MAQTPQGTQSDPAPQQPPAPLETKVTVMVIAPDAPRRRRGASLAGAGARPSGHRPRAHDSGALDLSDFLNRRFNGVHVNEVQGNPFQPDINYRGYTASPLLGTPQGLSIYMDGVRLNQPFGDVVSWDLIPRMAIATVALMPGSNPLFGAEHTGRRAVGADKGRPDVPGHHRAGDLRQQRPARPGDRARRALGRRNVSTGTWPAPSSAKDGWRVDSPSDVRQVFGKLGGAGALRGHDVGGLRGQRADRERAAGRRSAAQDHRSLYTKPDVTDNRSTLVNVTGNASGRTPSR
jgi:hypothetical protein